MEEKLCLNFMESDSSSKITEGKKSFYITTTLPYVNAEPHVGFAMELIRADIIARWKDSQGFDVFFNTGTDEHGQKLFIAASDAGVDVQTYVDQGAEKFRGLLETLGIFLDVHFIRTTDSNHVEAAQEFWKVCDKNGYIYKKNYETKYCIGCELEKTDSDLENGKCPIHPNLEVEVINEENYFFKFSAFGEKLLNHYQDNLDFVVPDFRFNEIKAFVERGLEDFSISRLKEKMSWGVPVPNDSDHVMYVWFDALVNYISTLGWPGDKDNFNKYWAEGTPVQYCGKDNLRQQSAMWQAMLMAAGLPNSHQVVINGFVTGAGGVKMSKSLGNVVNPYEIVNEYGSEALRYFVTREISTFEDSPFTVERFKDAYNAGLANGLGNLVSRIMKMSESNDIRLEKFENSFSEEYVNGLNNFELKKTIDLVWERVTDLDGYIQENEPFKKIKVDFEEGKKHILYLLNELRGIAVGLHPFLPETSAAIIELINTNKSPEAPLFARKD